MDILLSPIRSHHFISPAILISVNSAASVLTLILKTASAIAASIVHSKLDYCNSLHYSFPKSQINRLQQIQYCLERSVSSSKVIILIPFDSVLRFLHIWRVIWRNVKTTRFSTLKKKQNTFCWTLVRVKRWGEMRWCDLVSTARRVLDARWRVHHWTSVEWNW